MNEEIKVFISSQMKLEEERNLAKDIIDQGLGAKSILYEYEPPESNARKWWERNISEARFFVFILENFLSYPIYDEFKTADTIGLHILAFVKDRDFLEKLNPNALRNLSDKDKAGLYNPKITEENPEAIEWFYSKFTDPEGIKWAPFEDFRKMLKKGILKKIPERFPGIKIDEIYPNEEVARINKIFVPPKNFDDAVQKLNDNRLLIIVGPGSIGKTTMGLKLLRNIMEVESNAQRDIIMPEATAERLGRLRDRKNSLIFFDAPFGGHDEYEPKDPNFAAKFSEVFDLCRKNWVVITSRSKAFEDAAPIIERRGIDRYKICLEHDGYREDDLRQILQNHLDYYLSREEITNGVYNFVADADKQHWIIRNLTFPHNICMLVKYELRGVHDQERLKEAIDTSKDTKEASNKYFNKLTNEEKYFALAIALFHDRFNMENFKPILEKIFSLYSLPTTNLNIPSLREKVRYVRKWGRLAFEHQDYLDGIIEALRNETFNEDIKRFKKLLQYLSKDPNPDIRRCVWFPLRELVRVDPKEALPIVLHLFSDSDHIVVKSSFVPLKHLVENHSEEIVPILEKSVQIDEKTKLDPNYNRIVFRKAMRDRVIGPYIDRKDAKGLVKLTNELNPYLKLYVNITIKLIDVYKVDKSKATEFFAKWYEEDSRAAIRSLQDMMWKSVIVAGREFIADALVTIPPEKGLEAIIAWSKTETKRSEVRKKHVVIISLCLKKIYRKIPDKVSALLEEWEIKGNEIQKDVAKSRYFSDAHQLK